MGNHDNRQISCLLLLDIQNGILDFGLTFWVKCASSFIKHQDLGFFDQSAGNRDSLLLPSWQVEDGARANICFKAFLHLVDKVSVRKIDSSFDVLVIGVFVAIEKIFTDCAYN